MYILNKYFSIQSFSSQNLISKKLFAYVLRKDCSNELLNFKNFLQTIIKT